MSAITGPNNITNGLVLSLDAASQRSYVSGSNVWCDVSGNGNNGTLVSGSTYNSIAGGSIQFISTGSSVFSNLNSASTLNTNAITIESWIYHTSLPFGVQRYISTFPSGGEQAVLRYDANIGSNGLRFYIVTSTGYKFLNSAGQIFVNNWYHVVGTWDGSTQRLYKNGILLTSSTQTGTLVSGSFVQLSISYTPETLLGYMSNSKVYNRALSAAEIAQNFNSQRFRFGI